MPWFYKILECSDRLQGGFTFRFGCGIDRLQTGIIGACSVYQASTIMSTSTDREDVTGIWTAYWHISLRDL